MITSFLSIQHSNVATINARAQSTRDIKYNGSADFRSYASGGGNNVYLFKQNSGTITYDSNPDCTILKSFTIKWTEADIDFSTNAISIPTLNTDQTDCMEVYFELNDGYSTDDYEVYLEGGSVAKTQLGTELDMEGAPSAYICFGDINGWTGTLTVVEKSAPAVAIETYDVTVGSAITTGINEANKDKQVKAIQCYTLTGVQVNCNQAQGIIIKRTIFTDGSTGIVKELK